MEARLKAAEGPDYPAIADLPGLPDATAGDQQLAPSVLNFCSISRMPGGAACRPGRQTWFPTQNGGADGSTIGGKLSRDLCI
jgi:hypothetical protein